jgi:oligopeptide/dipeptide ABC transporter ATP-binding protein
MYLGRIVESWPSEPLYADPWPPYTKALASAILGVDPEAELAKARVVLTGELPSPFAPPSGCKFRTRCPQAHGACETGTPAG